MRLKRLQTRRLILRPIEQEDLFFVYKHFSDKDVTHYLYDNDPVKSIEEAQEILDFYIDIDPMIQCRWVMILKENQAIIGTCGFHKRDDQKHSVEVGYDLSKAYWQQGYTSEALQKIMEYAVKEMDIREIEAEISVDNIGSMKLAESLGFSVSSSYNVTFNNKDYMHHKYTKKLEIPGQSALEKYLDSK